MFFLNLKRRLGHKAFLQCQFSYLRNMNSFEQKKEAFGRLLTIMDELREQCPWDKNY